MKLQNSAGFSDEMGNLTEREDFSAYFDEELVSGYMRVTGDIHVKVLGRWIPTGMHLTQREVGVQPRAIERQWAFVRGSLGGGKHCIFGEARSGEDRLICVERTECNEVTRVSIERRPGAAKQEDSGQAAGAQQQNIGERSLPRYDSAAEEPREPLASST